MKKFHFQDGELADGSWLSKVTFNYTGIRIGRCTLTSDLAIDADKNERVIFVLEGSDISVEYTVYGKTHQRILRGRSSVFAGTADHLYLPAKTRVRISGDAKIAVGEAPTSERKIDVFISRDDVPVLIRGAGRECRQVHNFGMPENLDAARLIVVEVIVPSGNWSGTPAHKHDTYIPGLESNLEEIYYFEVSVKKGASAPQSAPFGIFRGYSSDHREFDLTAEVRTGDVVHVPYGWHGPVAPAPGYDMYFFNVMAGPDAKREWNVTNDPQQDWIREEWQMQSPDPRLPYTRG